MTSSLDLQKRADRLDELADAAELMGDDDQANQLRHQAHRNRLEAMNQTPPSPGPGQAGLR